jgi:riboflavin synthase
MFTGLVQAVAQVAHVHDAENGRVFGFSLLPDAAGNHLPGFGVSESVAIDGACMTVTRTENNGQLFWVDVSGESLDKTMMGHYAVGSHVNLERPITLSTPLGGHFVTGHVDGTGTLVSKASNGLGWVFRFRVANPALVPLLVEKGSVAVSGVSLTVNTIIEDVFSVAIIPYTYQHTTLGGLLPDDLVNIETDLLGKYVYRFLQGSPGSAQTGPVSGLYVAPGPGQPSWLHTGDWFNWQAPPLSSPTAPS